MDYKICGFTLKYVFFVFWDFHYPLSCEYLETGEMIMICKIVYVDIIRNLEHNGRLQHLSFPPW